MKLELKRILSEYSANSVNTIEPAHEDDVDMEKENDHHPEENIVEGLVAADAICQTQPYRAKMRSCRVQTTLKQKEAAGTQANLRPRYRSIAIQAGESFLAVKEDSVTSKETGDDIDSEQLDCSESSGYSRQSDVSLYQPPSDESSESDASSIFQGVDSEEQVMRGS